MTAWAHPLAQFAVQHVKVPGHWKAGVWIHPYTYTRHTKDKGGKGDGLSGELAKAEADAKRLDAKAAEVEKRIGKIHKKLADPATAQDAEDQLAQAGSDLFDIQQERGEAMAKVESLRQRIKEAKPPSLRDQLAAKKIEVADAASAIEEIRKTLARLDERRRAVGYAPESEQQALTDAIAMEARGIYSRQDAAVSKHAALLGEVGALEQRIEEEDKKDPTVRLREQVAEQEREIFRLGEQERRLSDEFKAIDAEYQRAGLDGKTVTRARLDKELNAKLDEIQATRREQERAVARIEGLNLQIAQAEKQPPVEDHAALKKQLDAKLAESKRLSQEEADAWDKYKNLGDRMANANDEFDMRSEAWMDDTPERRAAKAEVERLRGEMLKAWDEAEAAGRRQQDVLKDAAAIEARWLSTPHGRLEHQETILANLKRGMADLEQRNRDVRQQMADLNVEYDRAQQDVILAQDRMNREGANPETTAALEEAIARARATAGVSVKLQQDDEEIRRQLRERAPRIGEAEGRVEAARLEVQRAEWLTAAKKKLADAQAEADQIAKELEPLVEEDYQIKVEMNAAREELSAASLADMPLTPKAEERLAAAQERYTAVMDRQMAHWQATKNTDLYHRRNEIGAKINSLEAAIASRESTQQGGVLEGPLRRPLGPVQPDPHETLTSGGAEKWQKRVAELTTGDAAAGSSYKDQLYSTGHAERMKARVMVGLAARLADDDDFAAVIREFPQSPDRADATGRGVTPGREHVEDSVSGLIGNWATTAADANTLAHLIQEATAMEFGFKKHDYIGERNLTGRDRERYLDLRDDEQFMRGLRKFVRAQYEWTQDEFEQAGIEKIAVVRGMTMPWSGDRWAREDNILPIEMNPLSSWATDFDTAMDFTGAYQDGGSGDQAVVMAAVVDRSRILATPVTGFGCLGEYELVMLGDPTDAEAFVSPEAGSGGLDLEEFWDAYWKEYADYHGLTPQEAKRLAA